MRVSSKSIVLGTAVAFSAVLATPAFAQHHENESNHKEQVTTHSDQPINKLCPISQEPIDIAAGTIDYKGNTIAVCCAGCDDKFDAWDESRKDMFVKMALAGKEAQMSKHDAMASDADGGHAMEPVAAWTEPYALPTCPVSGEELGAMDETIVEVYDGREIRFCCEGCIEDFEADQATYIAKIDAMIIKDQLRYYPAQTCIVSGEPLVEDGEDIAVNMVYGNRLIRLCCKMCKKEFKADPKMFIAKLDKATADAQRESYPLDTCVVLGGELGAMGDPAEMVVAGRLLRFCCPMCKPKVKADPMKYIAAIDKAWQAQGMFMPVHLEANAEDAEHSEHGDHDGHESKTDEHGDEHEGGHDHSKHGG